MSGEFLFFRTRADGAPLEQPRRMSHREVIATVSLACPRMPARQLSHYVALAAAAPGHPVDVAHWEGDSLVFSARLERVAEREA